MTTLFSNLESTFRSRFGEPERTGPQPRLWYKLGYFTPDVHYEATVGALIESDTNWLDVGCGRSVFPGNESLARSLASRCHKLVGVDPDDTIQENLIVHERFHGPLESYSSSETFDVITLRMVAEHIVDPHAVVATLRRLTKVGGKVVIFTINRWSPVSLAAWLLPFRFHHSIKSVLWKTEEKDTFPVAYKMNTRIALRKVFRAHGFRERSFEYVSDCRTFFRFRLLHYAELATWKALRGIRLPYPENCILAVYERANTIGDCS